jgi:hypothetical protein
MNCPTCGTAMSQLGCNVTGRPFHNCPLCGTLRTCDGVVVVPDLVRRCRIFAETITAAYTEHAYLWKKMGLADAITPPGERTA